MKKPRFYFRAYLAALLLLAAVPAKAADVKELFAIDLADYPGKEGRVIEVSYPPGAQDMVIGPILMSSFKVPDGKFLLSFNVHLAVSFMMGQLSSSGPSLFTELGGNPTGPRRPGSARRP